MYLNCEIVVAETFGGRLPAGVRITSKCRLGTPPMDDIARRLEASVDASLAAMRVERIDLFFLHTNICEDDYVYAVRPDRQDVFATRWSAYAGGYIPAMEALIASGKVGHWGITGVGVPATILKTLGHAKKPAAVQAIANLLDSAGGMKNFAEPERPRAIIAAAVANSVGVMGIRAVQAGALTQLIDRECREIGQDPAMVAHRYALSMSGVDTVILGVKNRAELQQCLDAEAAGPLEPALMARIDGLGLRASA